MTTSAPPKPRLRTMLYVPANRAEWFDKAVASGADAIVLDMEDAVPSHDKEAARELVADFLRSMPPAPVFVRISPAGTRDAEDDLAALCSPELRGVLLAKCSGPADVHWAAERLAKAEQTLGLAPETFSVTPLFESARAMREAFSIASASGRVAYAGGLTARGGDVQRALGFRWTPQGMETLHLRSRILLDVRAADVPHPVSGVWTSVDDVEGLRHFAEQSRDLGYEGLAVIHPTHVDVVHDVFTPDEPELGHAEEVLGAVVEALCLDRATARVRGHMVDLAMATTAARDLQRAGRAPDLIRRYEELCHPHGS